MPLSRLIYYSENQLDPKLGRPLDQLSAIMKSSIKNNQARNITGALVFDDLWFIQALEGERSAILQLFERLKDDERHANISIATLIDIENRLFGNWWMGLATRNSSTEELFRPFLRCGKLYPDKMTGAQLTDFICSVAQLGLNRHLMTPA